MKKVLSVVAATLVLCLAVGTTCFAASPTNGATSKTEGVTAAKVEENVQAEVKKATTAEKLKEVLGTKFTEDAAVVSVFDLDGTVPADGKVTVTVAGVSADDKVAALHWKDGDTSKAPEVLDATVTADGTVTISGVTAFSPFAIVKLSAAATAPKTGEASTLAVYALIVLAGAGIYAVNRKKLA